MDIIIPPYLQPFITNEETDNAVTVLLIPLSGIELLLNDPNLASIKNEGMTLHRHVKEFAIVAKAYQLDVVGLIIRQTNYGYRFSQLTKTLQGCPTLVRSKIPTTTENSKEYELHPFEEYLTLYYNHI